MTMNVQGIRKICFESTLYFQASFIEFYVFVLDEIQVRGFKIIYDHIWVGNVREIISKDHQAVLEEGPKTVGMADPKRRSSQWPVMAVMPHQSVSSMSTYPCEGKESWTSHCIQRRRDVTPRRGCDASSRAGVARLVPSQVLLPIKG